MEILTIDLAITLDLYAQDYRYVFNEYLERKIKTDFKHSVNMVTIISLCLTDDILRIPKRNITYRNIFSILNVQHKNKNSIVDMEILDIKKKYLFDNIFKINKFQAIGWIYVFNLNEKIIFNHYQDCISQLPESCLKQSIKLNITRQCAEWRSFNRRLSKIDLNTKYVDQICNGIDQANYRFNEILRVYDE